MSSHLLYAAVSAPVLALSAPALTPAEAQTIALALVAAETDAPAIDNDQRDVVVVTGEKPAQQQNPATVETITAEQIATTTAVTNAEDSLRYLPNIVVRKRHVGDTFAPITTRTSGVGASARSLIYVDGLLISALIGNNNGNGSPKWGMVSPEEIASVDVYYGPFSAAYAGNSIGAVVEINTRMPEKFEGSLSAQGSLHKFDQYATDDTFNAWQTSAAIGNRFGPLSFWLSATHTDSSSHPLGYATVARSATAAQPADPVVIGAIADVNRTEAPILVLGATSLEDQVQDNFKLKAAWDIDANTRLAYTAGLFLNDTSSDVDTYLRDVSGGQFYAGGPVNINGNRYTIAASAFSNSVYSTDEQQWSHNLSLTGKLGADFDYRLVASVYDYDQSEQRLPSTALPAARAGAAGSIVRGDGTGWTTLDGKGVWRFAPGHELSFGLHGDEYELQNERYSTTNWINGAPGALTNASRGKTRTSAVWVQEAWDASDAVTVVVGGRFETWKASDGFNFSSSPVLSVNQPEVKSDNFSPKASVRWEFAPQWSAKASVGKAYRYPTVSELYQAITTGATLTVPNPNLRPEDALSTEWTVERMLEDGSIRLTYFTEDIDDALISQSAPLVTGSTQLFNYVQNIDKVESRGFEVVGEKDNVFIQGLSISGNITWVDSKTAEDTVFPAAVGKRTPGVPEWRATLVGTYRPDDHWAFTLAGRYFDRVYATIDNIDTVSHTYQGFEAFMTWDARAAYTFDEHWAASLSLENFAGNDYFLFHPFPQRTASAELTYRF
ncbi:MAG: TonB-dependent receptor [Hyphomonadaceae bacterium]